MCGGPSIKEPDELAIAKKQDKERNFASLGQLLRNAGIGAGLLRPPQRKRRGDQTK